jgi:hypothetical protein
MKIIRAVLLRILFSSNVNLEKPCSHWFLPNYNKAETDSLSIASLKTAFKKKNVEILPEHRAEKVKPIFPSF